MSGIPTPTPTQRNAIDSVYNSLIGLRSFQENSLQKQNQVQSILDTENERLISKKNEVDKASENQQRIIYFNDNNRKINAAYIKIVISVTVTLVVLWFLQIFNNAFNPPEYIMTILFITAAAIGVVISLNYYFIIKSRDNYNFDEIKKNPLPLPSTEVPSSGVSSPTIASASSSEDTCIGEECCYGDTKWDAEYKVCVVPASTSSVALTAAPTATPTVRHV